LSALSPYLLQTATEKMNWNSFHLPLVELFVAAGFSLAGARAQILSHVISIFETAE